MEIGHVICGQRGQSRTNPGRKRKTNIYENATVSLENKGIASCLSLPLSSDLGWRGGGRSPES